MVDEAVRATEALFSSVTSIPRVTVAFAQSIDGSLTRRRGEATALSGRDSRMYTHFLRSRHDAILVGEGTVRADDPQLTTRYWDGPDPLPVILDPYASVSPDAAIFRVVTERARGSGNGSPIVMCRPDVLNTRRATLLRERGARLLGYASRDAAEITRLLADHGIGSVMVEGGGSVLSSFLRDRCVDVVSVTVAPQFLAGYGYTVDPFRLKDHAWVVSGEDVIVIGRPVWE